MWPQPGVVPGAPETDGAPKGAPTQVARQSIQVSQPEKPPEARQDQPDLIPASVLRETVSLLREAQREATALLLERIDGAEVRAEAAEARAAAVEAKLGQVLDRLLEERRPWWSRFLGGLALALLVF